MLFSSSVDSAFLKFSCQGYSQVQCQCYSRVQLSMLFSSSSDNASLKFRFQSMLFSSSVDSVVLKLQFKMAHEVGAFFREPTEGGLAV